MRNNKISKLGIFITRRCNYRCLYCLKSSNVDPPDKLSLKEFEEIFRQAFKMGARRIVIAGEGEPLLDDLFFSLVDSANALGLEVDLSTNASLMNEKIAAWLWDRRVRIFAKLDSLDRVIHAALSGLIEMRDWKLWVRSGKSWLIPSGLKILLESGYGKDAGRLFRRHRLTVAAVVTKMNITGIRDILDFCRFARIGFYAETVIPTTSDHLRLVPEKSESDELFRRLLLRMDLETLVWHMGRCAFERAPFLDISGNVFLCFSDQRRVGNVREFSLDVLYGRQFALKRQKKSRGFPMSLGFRVCRARRIFDVAAEAKGTGQCTSIL